MRLNASSAKLSIQRELTAPSPYEGCRFRPGRQRQAGLLAGVAFLAGVSALAQQSQGLTPLTPTAVVAALDEQFQLRFLDLDHTPGMARLCVARSHTVLAQRTQGPPHSPARQSHLVQPTVRLEGLGAVSIPQCTRTVGRQSVAARKACIGCNTNRNPAVKPGDPLGFLVYLHRSTS
jgi:hypothetical protein